MEQVVVADASESVLNVVARRVRSLRAMRGVSRKILAERSGVSVRHLAQIEQGTANVSIKLLDRISYALGVNPAELMTEAVFDERAMLHDLIASLDAEACREAERLIRRELLTRQHNRSEFVSLIGLRGAGKSTLGRLLAEDLGVDFISITHLIESTAGMRVAEINDLSGQSGYRRYELTAVEVALAHPGGGVIEAGGSIVANRPAYNALLARSRVIWVQASPEEHMNRVIEQGDLRPMEGRSDAMDDLVAMLEERTPLYALAHSTLDTSGRDLITSLEELKTIAGLRRTAA